MVKFKSCAPKTNDSNCKCVSGNTERTLLTQDVLAMNDGDPKKQFVAASDYDGLEMHLKLTQSALAEAIAFAERVLMRRDCCPCYQEVLDRLKSKVARAMSDDPWENGRYGNDERYVRTHAPDEYEGA